jgi:hypothetical protein
MLLLALFLTAWCSSITTASALSSKILTRRHLPPLHPPLHVASKIRGSHYANTTILTPIDAASKVGVRPTLETSKEVWQRAWRLHKAVLPALHFWDACEMKDSKLALACLWWKAM